MENVWCFLFFSSGSNNILAKRWKNWKIFRNVLVNLSLSTSALSHTWATFSKLFPWKIINIIVNANCECICDLRVLQNGSQNLCILLRVRVGCCFATVSLGLFSLGVQENRKKRKTTILVSSGAGANSLWSCHIFTKCCSQRPEEWTLLETKHFNFSCLLSAEMELSSALLMLVNFDF